MIGELLARRVPLTPNKKLILYNTEAIECLYFYVYLNLIQTESSLKIKLNAI